MFIAMNHFTVDLKQADTFEDVWKNRDSHLSEMKGFLGFQMLRGNPDESEGKIVYVSKTDWENEAAFVAWTNSEQFKAAHAKSKMPKGVILGPPKFLGYTVAFNQ